MRTRRLIVCGHDVKNDLSNVDRLPKENDMDVGN